MYYVVVSRQPQGPGSRKEKRGYEGRRKESVDIFTFENENLKRYFLKCIVNTMINIYRHFTNETWKVCSWLKDE